MHYLQDGIKNRSMTFINKIIINNIVIIRKDAEYNESIEITKHILNIYKYLYLIFRI